MKNLHDRWEVRRSAVTKDEMTAIGKSYLLSWDPLYMSHFGCVGRLVVCGWSLEVFRPAAALCEAVGDA